jgi:uncharacterized membrane protein YgdD (TMEM256/DUF423 family)
MRALHLPLILAAVSGALSIALGAFGAHGLRSRVSPELLETWRTAAGYHQLHSVVLLTLAVYALATGRSAALSSGLFGAGILFFSGSLYLLVLTGQRGFGAVAPVGGLLLIAGWLSLLRLARFGA